MIEYGQESDVAEILELCLTTHPARERDFLQYYFHTQFQKGKSYFIREDEKLVSCMQMQEHEVVFQDHILLCSYIFGVSTHVDYRLRGFMDSLMNHVLDVCHQNYLITFIEAYNPKLYKKYGFETISYRKKYSISASDLKVKNTVGVSAQVEAEQLATLYNEFSKRFDCFYVRDEAYYEAYLQAIESSKGKVALYHDPKGMLKGYCVYYEQDDQVEVKELIYLDALAVYKLLKYAIAYMPYISLEVSNNERIEKIFKRSIPRTNTCVMARINNYTLFEKLYGESAKHVEAAFRVLKKPVLINEKF